MNIDQLEIKLRRRGLWEAVDLGFLLAQKHFVSLWLAWMAGALPVAIILSVVFYKSPLWVVFIVWLFKPVYENVMLHILSQRIFGQNASLMPVFKTYLSVNKGIGVYSLIVSRITLNRNFTAPVSLLEGQKGKARKLRISQLSLSMQNVTQFVTILLFLVEQLLVYTTVVFLISLLPFELFDHGIHALSSNELFLSWGGTIILFFVMSLIAPFYVSSGFSLYLSRRTELEAWDIELNFKKLIHRIEASKNQRNLPSGIHSKRGVGV